MDTLWAVVTIMFAIWGYNHGQSLSQPEHVVTVKDGDSVTFNCTSDSEDPNLMWYRQTLNGAPQFILHDNSKEEELQLKFRHSFKGLFDQKEKTFSLMISDTQATDMAIYYCVHRAGSTYTRALTFGQGTQLSVQPKAQVHLQPSVFTLRSENSAACLAIDLHPKEVEIFMNSSSGVSTGLQEVVPVLSASGSYSAIYMAAFPSSEDVQCGVLHEKVLVMGNKDITAQQDNPSLDVKQPNEAEKCETRPTWLNERPDKINTLLLTLMGLRMLFLKSLVFNLLLSARIFVI